VYYVSARELDDPVLRERDDVARVLAGRQYADWRELRFEPFTSPLVHKTIAVLASRMRDTFWQLPAVPARHARLIRTTGSSIGSAEQAGDAGTVTAKTEPPTHVVDAWQRGDFTTVGAAIKAAKPGDRILVRPGLYEEGLVVDKPLEILGDGLVSDIEIRASGASALVFKASIGRVANLTLRQAGGEGNWYSVNITQGRLDLEGCDISSQSLSGVAIRNGADPRLRRNRLHDSKESGVHVLDSGLGTLEDNDITGNFYTGVAITTGGNPILRRNRIHDNKQSGVFVYNSGLGTLEDNDITGNGEAGVETKKGGNPTVRANRINGNEYQAVWVYEGGRGVIEDNDLTGNAKGAWSIPMDNKANVTRARNKE
jgi:parallel beta-helix repeat protein